MIENGRVVIYESHVAYRCDYPADFNADLDSTGEASESQEAEADISSQPLTTSDDDERVPAGNLQGEKQVTRTKGSLRHYISLMGAVRLSIFLTFVLLLVGCSVGQSKDFP